MTPVITDSIPKQFTFEQEKLPPVVVNFHGGLVTSDAGLSLIADIDRKLQITSRLAQYFQDYRERNRSSQNTVTIPVICNFAATLYFQQLVIPASYQLPLISQFLGCMLLLKLTDIYPALPHSSPV